MGLQHVRGLLNTSLYRAARFTLLTHPPAWMASFIAASKRQASKQAGRLAGGRPDTLMTALLRLQKIIPPKELLTAECLINESITVLSWPWCIGKQQSVIAEDRNYSQSVSQSVSQPVSQSVSQPVDQLTRKANKKRVCQCCRRVLPKARSRCAKDDFLRKCSKKRHTERPISLYFGNNAYNRHIEI